MPFQSQLLLVTWDMLPSQVEEVPLDRNISVTIFFFYWLILAKVKKSNIKTTECHWRGPIWLGFKIVRQVVVKKIGSPN